MKIYYVIYRGDIIYTTTTLDDAKKEAASLYNFGYEIVSVQATSEFNTYRSQEEIIKAIEENRIRNNG